jgi:hypothetical protein
MDNPTVVIWLLGFGVAAATALLFWWISWRVKQARKWPVTDATIEAAAVERVGGGRRAADLPCFAFSYTIKGQNFSGCFALRAARDRADSVIKQLLHKKMEIRYDPKWPAGWYIPVDTIGGCEVIQKLRLKLETEQPND